MATILTVEDDAAIRRGIVDAVCFAGHHAIQAADYASACEAALRREYDLLLLDLVLPGGSGIDLLKQLRLSRPTTPVIILSAKGEEADRVRGLRCGADDYVVKPFGVRELLARIDAVLRRSPSRPLDVQRLDLDGVTIDLERGEARFADGSLEPLTERETLLLRYLAVNASRPVSRDELLSNVWQIDSVNMSTRVVDMTVSRLRDKLTLLERDGSPLVQTVHGKGYMLRSGIAAVSDPSRS